MVNCLLTAQNHPFFAKIQGTGFARHCAWQLWYHLWSIRLRRKTRRGAARAKTRQKTHKNPCCRSRFSRAPATPRCPYQERPLSISLIAAIRRSALPDLHAGALRATRVNKRAFMRFTPRPRAQKWRAQCAGLKTVYLNTNLYKIYPPRLRHNKAMLLGSLLTRMLPQF